MPTLSVIIPVGPGESGLGRLAADLLLLPEETEILLVLGGHASRFADRPRLERLLRGRPLRWLEAPVGRAAQLNAGARQAQGRFLWFLHADSGFDPALVQALLAALRHWPGALHYARLAFMADGPGWMGLNAWGANLRARWLGVPFGDQGFCLSAALFQRLGGYDETVPYGEDHLLVWAARRRGVPLRALGAPLLTSARKYRQRGWGALTLTYQWLWLRQALPQCWALLRGR